jgi:hypothetical protein
MDCINCVENAVDNMLKIVNTYLLNKTRPEKFRRDYKFSEKIKNDNPINNNINNLNNSVKCHCPMGTIIFFLLQSVSAFGKKGAISFPERKQI